MCVYVHMHVYVCVQMCTHPLSYIHTVLDPQPTLTPQHRLKDVIYHRRGGQAPHQRQGQGQRLVREGEGGGGVSEQEERHLAMLDRGFLPSTQLFAVRFYPQRIVVGLRGDRGRACICNTQN